MNNLESAFEAFSIAETLSRAEVRTAFRRNALEVHPDKSGESAAASEKTKAAADKVGTELTDLLVRYLELDPRRRPVRWI